MGANAEVVSPGGHGLAPAQECHACVLPVRPKSWQLPSILCNQVTGGLPLGLLQAELVSSEITLLTGSDLGNLATGPNSRSWRYLIVQVIGDQVVPVITP